jgi:hypothetical protein
LNLKYYLLVSSLCFRGKCNVYRYSETAIPFVREKGLGWVLPLHETSVGLCRLNQVDPYPIAYNLSNP